MKLIPKKSITLVLLILATSCIGQVTFTSIPIDYQLIGRDRITNTGNIKITGIADNSITQYDSIVIELFRNDLYQNRYSKILEYESNIASFEFNINIEAELANYSLKIYSQSGIESHLEKEVENIVSGDVFIIQGQSNAEAAMMLGSSSAYQDEFIRVFANGTHFSNQLPDDNNWYIGQGDGFRTSPGNTGQWGLKLAKMLVDTLQIPIAIFNGGHGGKDISFFHCPANYQISLDSNYSRLYYRLNKTGLKEFVRAILWSQGEWDGTNFSNTSTEEYKTTFQNLLNDWYRDYQNIEHIYIFQTKNGCGGNVHRIKEAQRQLSYENSHISIMSTAALTHFEDECHFQFVDGYESFANRIFPLVTRDLYQMPAYGDIDAPMINYAEIINTHTLVIGTSASHLQINSSAEDFYLENHEGSIILNTETSNNKIYFTLSKNPGEGATISYLAQETGAGNFITNQNGIEILCFYRFPIALNAINNDTLAKIPDIYPNPSSGKIHIEMPYYTSVARLALFDIAGSKIRSVTKNSMSFEIDLNVDSGSYLLQIADNNGNIFMQKIIIF